MVVLKRILKCFELVSGLKVNLDKSMVTSVRCHSEEIQVSANRLHCKVGKLAFLYLGLPIGAKSGLK